MAKGDWQELTKEWLEGLMQEQGLATPSLLIKFLDRREFNQRGKHIEGRIIRSILKGTYKTKPSNRYLFSVIAKVETRLRDNPMTEPETISEFQLDDVADAIETMFVRWCDHFRWPHRNRYSRVSTKIEEVAANIPERISVKPDRTNIAKWAKGTITPSPQYMYLMRLIEEEVSGATLTDEEFYSSLGLDLPSERSEVHTKIQLGEVLEKLNGALFAQRQDRQTIADLERRVSALESMARAASLPKEVQHYSLITYIREALESIGSLESVTFLGQVASLMDSTPKGIKSILEGNTQVDWSDALIKDWAFVLNALSESNDYKQETLKRLRDEGSVESQNYG